MCPLSWILSPGIAKKEITESKHLYPFSSLYHSSINSPHCNQSNIFKTVFDYAVLLVKTFLWLYNALRQRTRMLIWFTVPRKPGLFLLSKLLFSLLQLSFRPTHTTPSTTMTYHILHTIFHPDIIIHSYETLIFLFS